MPTPSIQTLVNDAQSVLALQNMTYIRSVMAVALANANTGTPLSTSLTNQQLINEARQVITLPKSDIESIIVNQLMKFLATPPAPGGVGADKQVIWNDAGVLAGDPNFTWDGPLSLLKVTGAATITGNLTVDTNTLFVDSANNRVGIGTATPSAALDVNGASNLNGNVTIANTGSPFGTLFVTGSALELQANSNATNGLSLKTTSTTPIIFSVNSSEAMRLNSTGLGVGGSPSTRFEVFSGFIKNTATTGSAQIIANNTGGVFTLAKDSSTGGNFTGTAYASVLYSDGAYPVCIFSNGSERLRIDSSGNVGIGVTPSIVWTANGNLQVGIHAALYTNASLGATDLAYNSIRTGSDTYQYLFATSLAASRLQQRDGSFRFFTAPAGTSPNAITFTERLRLKETGQLRFVPLAADPAGAEAGDVYYNSTSNKLKCYNGTTWNDLF